MRQFTINERYIAVVTDVGLRVSQTQAVAYNSSYRGFYREAVYPLDPDALSPRWAVVDANEGGCDSQIIFLQPFHTFMGNLGAIFKAPVRVFCGGLFCVLCLKVSFVWTLMGVIVG